MKFIGINIVGLKNNFSNEIINNIKNTYRIFSNMGYNTSQALKILDKKEKAKKKKKRNY